MTRRLIGWVVGRIMRRRTSLDRIVREARAVLVAKGVEVSGLSDLQVLQVVQRFQARKASDN